jgi:hypothetical protein
MYFESGELHGGNEKNKVQLMDGVVMGANKVNCTSSNYIGSGSDDNENTHDAEDD